jgi:Skp family chaperone for outer membrane proteins
MGRKVKLQSMENLAALTGKDRRTVKRELAAAGVKLKGDASNLKILARGERERAAMKAVRLRSLTASAEEAELDLAERRRELIPLAEVKHVLTRYVTALKSKSFTAMRTAAQEGGLKVGLTGPQISTLEEITESRLGDVYEILSKGMETWME